MEQCPAPLIRERTEAQRISERNWPCPHREDVADNAADTSRRPLKRLNSTRVIVGLDFQHDNEPLAQLNRASVLAWSLDHAGAGGWQALEERPCVLIATVLTPERAKHSEFKLIRLTPQQCHNALIFILG